MSPKKSNSSSLVDPKSSTGGRNGNFQLQGGYYEGYTLPNDNSNVNIIMKSNIAPLQATSYSQPPSDMRIQQQMTSLPSPNHQGQLGTKLGTVPNNNMNFSKTNTELGYLHNSQSDQSPLVLSPGSNGGIMTTMTTPIIPTMKQPEINPSTLHNQLQTRQHDLNYTQQLNQQGQNLNQTVSGSNVASSGPGQYFVPFMDNTGRTSGTLNKSSHMDTVKASNPNANGIAHIGGPFYPGLAVNLEANSRHTSGGSQMQFLEQSQGPNKGQLSHSQQRFPTQSKSSPTVGMGSGLNSNPHQNVNSFYVDPITGMTAYAIGQYHQGHVLTKAPSSTIHSAYNGANDSDGNVNTLSANGQSAANTSATINQRPIQMFNNPMTLPMPLSNGNHHSTGMTLDGAPSMIGNNQQDISSASRNMKHNIAPYSFIHHTQLTQQNNPTQNSSNDTVATNFSTTSTSTGWVDVKGKDNSPVLNANIAVKAHPSIVTKQTSSKPVRQGPIVQSSTVSNTQPNTLQPSLSINSGGNIVGSGVLVGGTTNISSDMSQNSLLGSPKDHSVVKRRQDRNAREQKRSMRISQQINNLKAILENDGRRTKNSKIAILIAAEQYIRDLEKQAHDLDEKLRQVYKETGYPPSYKGQEQSQTWTMVNHDVQSNGQEEQSQKILHNQHQPMNQNDKDIHQKTGTYYGQATTRCNNTNDGYFTDSDSEDEDFENEYEFQQRQNNGQLQGQRVGQEQQVQNDSKGMEKNNNIEIESGQGLQNMGGSLSQTGSQMEQCSDSVSATPSSSLPSKMEKMHMQGSVTSSPSSENIIERTGKESSECDIISYRTSSSKRRRYYIEEKPVSEASHLREQNDSFLSNEKFPIHRENGDQRTISNGRELHNPFADHSVAFACNYVAIAVASEEGQFLDANRAFEELSGYSKDELKKLTFFNLIHSDHLDESFSHVARLLANGSAKQQCVETENRDAMKEESKDKEICLETNSTREGVALDSTDKSEDMDLVLHGKAQAGGAKLSFHALSKAHAESKHGDADSKNSSFLDQLQLTISVGPASDGTSKVFYCSLINQKSHGESHKKKDQN